MSLAHRYQEFGSSLTYSSHDLNPGAFDIDGEKLKSFEDGYQAGWEDSLRAKNETHEGITSDLAKNLQDVSFGYHEARSTLTQSLRPLFEEIMNKLLPETVRTSIGLHIVEQLTNMVRDQSDQLIEIVVSPFNFETLKNLLEEQVSDPFVLLVQPDLAEGQVYIRLGTQEREIDFEKVIQEIRNSTNNLFEEEPVDG